MCACVCGWMFSTLQFDVARARSSPQYFSLLLASSNLRRMALVACFRGHQSATATAVVRSFVRSLVYLVWFYAALRLVVKYGRERDKRHIYTKYVFVRTEHFLGIVCHPSQWWCWVGLESSKQTKNLPPATVQLSSLRSLPLPRSFPLCAPSVCHSSMMHRPDATRVAPVYGKGRKRFSLG